MKLFRTHYDTEVSTYGVGAEPFIVYTVSACQALQWEITYITSSGVKALSPVTETGVRQEIIIRKITRGYAISSGNHQNNLLDWNRNERLVNQFRDEFAQQQELLSEEDLIYRYDIIQGFWSAGPDVLEQRAFESHRKPEGWQAFLMPERGYAATPILVWINVLLFVVMVIGGVSPIDPTATSLVAWGGNYGAALIQGAWWRLLTAAFLHAGVIHLLSNMIALVYVGAFLEPLIGTQRFAMAYVIAALCASLFGFYIHPDVVSVGASGAVFGMFGVLLSLLTTRLIPKDIRRRLLLLLGYYVVYNLLYGMKEGIDNAGHIGGMVTGFVFGYWYYFSLRAQQAKAVSTLVA